MNAQLTFKKIGSHWYPNIFHDCVYDIVLDKHVENILEYFDKSNTGVIEITMQEQFSYLIEPILEFNEEDINRYFLTDDQFDLRFYVNQHEFKISSELYTLLENQYNFNFHKELYRITIN